MVTTLTRALKGSLKHPFHFSFSCSQALTRALKGSLKHPFHLSFSRSQALTRALKGSLKHPFHLSFSCLQAQDQTLTGTLRITETLPTAPPSLAFTFVSTSFWQSPPIRSLLYSCACAMASPSRSAMTSLPVTATGQYPPVMASQKSSESRRSNFSLLILLENCKRTMTESTGSSNNETVVNEGWEKRSRHTMG